MLTSIEQTLISSYLTPSSVAANPKFSHIVQDVQIFIVLCYGNDVCHCFKRKILLTNSTTLYYYWIQCSQLAFSTQVTIMALGFHDNSLTPHCRPSSNCFTLICWASSAIDNFSWMSFSVLVPVFWRACCIFTLILLYNLPVFCTCKYSV